MRWSRWTAENTHAASSHHCDFFCTKFTLVSVTNCTKSPEEKPGKRQHIYIFAAFLLNNGWGNHSICYQVISRISLRRKVPHPQPPYFCSVFMKQLKLTRLSDGCTRWNLQLLKWVAWKGSENWLLLRHSFTRIFPFTLVVPGHRQKVEVLAPSCLLCRFRTMAKTVLQWSASLPSQASSSNPDMLVNPVVYLKWHECRKKYRAVQSQKYQRYTLFIHHFST